MVVSSDLLPQNNILISTIDDPNEPSIKIDPNNPQYIVVGANIDNYYYSSDTGRTWTISYLTSTYGVWGDPVIDVDTNGNFYFFHLSNYSSGEWIDRIVCQKSNNYGETWSSGTYAGLNGTKQQDKEWSIIDYRNNNIYITWIQFDEYGSTNSLDSSTILFSKSLNGGNTWSQPQRISKFAGNCVDNDTTVEGATPAVGPDGQIYVVWASIDGLMFNKSYDEGETWLPQEINISDMPGGWAYDVPGIFRCNGLPVIKCDLSGGENNGTLYVNWSDQRNGSDDTDIWLIKSTDEGETWSEPIRVNDDETNTHQFFTWMDIDRTNGYLYFVFYDRRNYVNEYTDVYMAASYDGGLTFINKKISEEPFFPNKGVFFGDYTNISAHNGIIRPVWTRLHNGQLSIWTDISDFGGNNVNNDVIVRDLEFSQYPNPTDDKIYVSFKSELTYNFSGFTGDS